ncbi:fatty acid desaturase family protein [Leptospira brenneri]|uniref:fatty acid desaturase family protein n=1 Tax=Leptospira brenneri TaxID=2023182 RepID=UPI0013FE49C7|nr:fatty acid desaturase [Leptospira brenneri]
MRSTSLNHQTIICLVSLSFLLLTNYALLHEAAHGNYHKNPKLNAFGGRLAGFLFPISYTLVRVTHSKHHACNRTIYESFDLITKNDNRMIKYLQWYSILTGFFWPSAVLGNVLVALFPNARNWKVFKNRKSTMVMLEDLVPSDIPKIRWETTTYILIWSILFYSGLIHPTGIVILYFCFAINWSTRQYITHAYTQRKVVEGAFNLETSRWHELLLLNGNWDREHHEHPEFPWTLLPRLGKKRKTDISYLKQYWKMWLGPVHSKEPPPLPLPVERQF